MTDPVPPPISRTAQAIAWHARQAPDGPADVESGARISYRDLAWDLAGWVRFLDQAGLRSGMLVGVEIGPRRSLHLMLFLACEVIGVIATAFTQTDRMDDDPVLPDCAVLVLTSPPAQAYRQTVVVAPEALPAACMPETDDWQVLDRQPDMQRIVRISRTSGSTGRQKAVPISYEVQQRIVSQRRAYLPEAVRQTPRLLCLYRLGIRAIYTRVYTTLQAGGTVVFAAEEQAPTLLEAGAVNWLPIILGHAEAIVRQTAGVSSGMTILVEPIGARTSRSLRNLITERLGAEIHLSYSCNEVNTITYIGEDNIGALCAGTVVRIVDEAGQDKAPGETGLIRVRTATMAAGYWNDPVLTAATFVDGWYHTNDGGFVPEPGKLVVLGRADDMLNIGGIKLPPAPIEDEIKQISGVLDVVLLTMPNSGGVDTLLVAVELRDHRRTGQPPREDRTDCHALRQIISFPATAVFSADRDGKDPPQ